MFVCRRTQTRLQEKYWVQHPAAGSIARVSAVPLQPPPFLFSHPSSKRSAWKSFVVSSVSAACFGLLLSVWSSDVSDAFRWGRWGMRPGEPLPPWVPLEKHWENSQQCSENYIINASESDCIGKGRSPSVGRARWVWCPQKKALVYKVMMLLSRDWIG